MITETKFSQIIDRVDANFYVNQLEILEKLRRIPKTRITKITTIGNVASFPKSKTPGRYDYVEKGVPVIKLKNMTEYFIDFYNVDYIPERLYSNFVQPEKGDILVTATGEGTIGRVCLFNEDVKCIVTAEVMIIRPNKNKINPYFLFSYLRTRYGKNLLTGFARGSTGQTHLYSKDVKLIPIPVPSDSFQKEIENLVKKAFQKRSVADEKFEKAKQILNNFFEIHKLEVKGVKTFETVFSKIKQSKILRFDAEYYRPKYEKVIELLKNNLKAKPLSQIITISTKKIDPKRYPTKVFKYVELADINSYTGEIEKFSEIYGYEAPSRARMIIKEGNILVASLAGSLDKVGLVNKQLDSQIASTGFFVIRSQYFYPEVLLILFKNPLIKLQLEKKTAGAIMPGISQDDFESLYIPEIDDKTQKTIQKLVQESLKLRKEAKYLMDKAREKVKKLIESR